MTNNKTLIIIPAFNEQETVPEVIQEIRETKIQADILLVDDGSGDLTFKVAQDKVDFCIQLPYHMGLGSALQTGYLFAKERNYDFAVHFDADGQHVAGQIEKILNPVKKNECDISIGSRFLNKQDASCRIPFARRAASKAISASLYLFTHKKIKDPTSGFRAINRKVILLFCENYPCDYPEVEELLILEKYNLRIREIPAEMRLRMKGKSSITLKASIFYMFKIFLILFIDYLWVTRLVRKSKKYENPFS